MKTCPQCSTGYPDSHTTCPTHGVLLNEIRGLKPGMVIHQSYRIVRKLGQGGMGAVYLAQHILMDEPRALKFLSPELSRDQAFTNRFLREVRVLRQIRNHHVVDCGDLEAAEDDSLFFSMEFVDGPDLRAFLRDAQSHSAEDHAALKEWVPPVPRHPDQAAASWVPPVPRFWGPGIPPLSPSGSLPVPLALSITRQIAEGLGAAHSRGMVHRDIKPENILMARDAAAWLPKIADFGIVATKESSTAYTRTGGTLLTMAYAAPEQWRGTPAAELDGRTDLYALGSLLYEMLTGQTPFHAENYEGWAEQHRNIAPQPPSALRPDLANWHGLDALVLRLLAKNREQRPKDVAELLGLLDAVQYLPPEAHRETVVERPRSHATELLRGKDYRQVPRWLWITLASVMVLAIVIAGLAVGLPSSTIAKRANELDKAHLYNLGGILRNLACTRRDVDSCLQLGFMYESGDGVEDDAQRAAAFFSRACDAGNALGCIRLGLMYDNGNGVGQNPARAAELYSRGVALLDKACDAGGTYDCFHLGLLYSRGSGVTQDYSRAATLYSKSCDGGSAQGCCNLGFLYEYGNGVVKDYFRALALYSKACDGGVAVGCRNLGNLYWNGWGVDKDMGRPKIFSTRAVRWATNWDATGSRNCHSNVRRFRKV
jgi:serine/threonine protein kinase